MYMSVYRHMHMYTYEDTSAEIILQVSISCYSFIYLFVGCYYVFMYSCVHNPVEGSYRLSSGPQSLKDLELS